jgi:hypothetical protein
MLRGQRSRQLQQQTVLGTGDDNDDFLLSVRTVQGLMLPGGISSTQVTWKTRNSTVAFVLWRVCKALTACFQGFSSVHRDLALQSSV